LEDLFQIGGIKCEIKDRKNWRKIIFFKWQKIKFRGINIKIIKENQNNNLTGNVTVAAQEIGGKWTFIPYPIQDDFVSI
jgi:hypothetical protein